MTSKSADLTQVVKVDSVLCHRNLSVDIIALRSQLSVTKFREENNSVGHCCLFVFAKMWNDGLIDGVYLK